MSEEELRVCMNAHGEYLIRLAFMYVKSWQSAEDIVQEVFVTFYHKSDQYKGLASVKTYLSKITVNLCHNHLKSWKNRISLFAGNAFNTSSDHETPETLLTNRQTSNEVAETILALPINYREVILLYYYQEFSVAEISDILNCPEGTIKTRLSRARTALRKKLDRTDMEVM
ncbi:RNA polymerase sigma factor [Jeotgalibacillus malaysiensis]|uniref:RNA polymerase sigma factor n=1 Tax=Jeotgalibacillus malaysiensis TaxID=1508404 RepID=UPI003850FE99